jgi:hypothetical protein
MQEWAPQAMLFGLAMDLALLGTIHLRLWKDRYKGQLIALASMLSLGAVGGLIWSDINSSKAEMLLVVYEVLLPAVLFMQLARFLPNKHYQWALLPISAMMMIYALISGWGFQSTQMLYYDLIILVVLSVVVLALFVRSAYSEQELPFILGGLVLILILGPGYGFLWSNLDINKAIFAIVGSTSGALIVLGRLKSSFVHFNIPSVQARKGKVKTKNVSIPGGIFVVPHERYPEAKTAFEEDIISGRAGLWISMDPISNKLGPKKGMSGYGGLISAQLTHSTFVEDALDPMKTDSIRRSLSEYLKMTGNGMIFIKDLHYMISNTDIWEVVELLKYLREKSASKDWTILLGSELIDEWELENMEKAGIGAWE